MIRQLAILFGCLALGELIIYLTHIPLPSSILAVYQENPFTKNIFTPSSITAMPGGTKKKPILPTRKSEILRTHSSRITFNFRILVLAVTGWVHQFYGKAKGKLKR